MNSLLLLALAAAVWVWNALNSARTASILCVVVLLGLAEVNSRVTDLQRRLAEAEEHRELAADAEDFPDDL